MLARRTLLAVIALLALVAVSNAAGVEVDGHTASAAPAYVEPSTQTAFTIALTNKPASPADADRARIGIPAGFVVDAASVHASTVAAGGCVASTWIADGTLIAGGKINLKRPGGGSNTRLCPGATLTVTLSATAPATDGSHVWATELLRGEDTFVLTGPLPSVTVDGTPPTVTINSHPPNSSTDAAPSFAFSANEPANFECKLDAGAFATCTSPVTYTSLADGRHTFAVRAMDSTQHQGPPTIYSWTIDTTGPAVAIAEKPSNTTNSRAATFAFSASEPAAFQCKLDDGAFAACESPRTYTNLSEGSHAFVVRATDALGNVGADMAHGWMIETRVPAVAVTSSPPDRTNSRTASFSFSADEPATFQCNLDGRGFEPCSSPASYAGLRDGGHSFVAWATDAAGNVGATSRAWTIDTTAPQTTIKSAPRATMTAVAATFTFSASEPASFQCRLDSAEFSRCSSPAAFSRLARGRHRFSVRAVDSAGNVDATPASFEWTVVSTKRVVAVSALLAPTAGARVSAPPVLRWRAVARATYYNVQLYRAGRKVLSVWPTRPRLRLHMRWRFNGRAEHLRPGTYRWYVWPGYGNPAARRYGRLLGTSTFVVSRYATTR